MNMKYIAGGTLTLSTLALAAGLALFLLSLMPMLALGLIIAAAGLFAALALAVLVKAIINYRNRPVLEKAIAAKVVEEDGTPIVRVIDEEDVKLTAAQKDLLADIKALDLTELAKLVNGIVAIAKKIHPCAILDNLAIAYPLGAANGVATRALDETVADEAYSKKWGKSLGINGYICQVSKVWAVYTCVYNHIDDLRNTEGYSDYIKLCRMANVIGYLVELMKEIKRVEELQPKMSVEAWEALSVKASPPIIKRQEHYFDYDEQQLAQWAALPKKAPQANGLAAAVPSITASGA